MQQRIFVPPEIIIFNPDTQVFSVKDGEKVDIKVTAECQWLRKLFANNAGKEEHCGNQYIVRLYEGKLKNKILGFMTLNVIPLRDKCIYIGIGGADIYMDKQGRTISHVYINHMENSTYNCDLNSYEYIHVGTALHECAFRLSLLKGCEGRVAFKAIDNSHYFHYKNGFRFSPVFLEYERLAQFANKARNHQVQDQLGCNFMYLPRKCIESNLSKYGIDFPLSDFLTEPDYYIDLITGMEQMITHAENNSLAWQAHKILNTPYGNRNELKDVYMVFDEDGVPATSETMYSKDYPSLFCENTKAQINKLATTLISAYLYQPLDKIESLPIFLAGTMIHTMASQDRKYGCQSLYNNAPLYPIELTELMAKCGTSEYIETVKAIGMKALIEKSIPFSIEMCERFFPALNKFPDLVNMLKQGQTLTRSATDKNATTQGVSKSRTRNGVCRC